MRRLKLNKKITACGVLLSVLLCAGCRTFGGVQKETAPLNYTDSDVVQNEKKRIDAMLMDNPVQAYWRALLLDDEETVEKCVSVINEKTKISLEEKKYDEAWRFIRSLEMTGRSYEEMSFSEVDELLRNDVPGLKEDVEKLPNGIKECVKATVTILVDKGLRIQNGAGYADKVIGSGFFIDRRGYIVTNHHVISDMVNPKYEGYSRLYIKLQGNEDDRIPARVVGYDSSIDLALLKCEIEPEFVLSLGSSEELSVGDKVNVIGAPLGLEGSITAGIVSYTERKLFTTGNVFQIDAPVNSGNSGGPCIDSSMKVQAVVFAGILQSQGLNFAIPVEYLKQELPFLYAGDKVMHSWTGCFGRTKRNGPKKEGVEIQYVMPGSPARLAGVVPGDVITSIDGKPVDSIEGLQNCFRELTPGILVRFGFESGKEILLCLEKRPDAPSVEVYNSDLIANSAVPLFGLRLVPSSTTSRNTYKVTEVIPGSLGDELSFAPNDPVTVKDVILDGEGKFVYAQIITQRHKKNLFDVVMVLSASYDNQNYF